VRLILASMIAALAFATFGVARTTEAAGEVPFRACLEIQKAGIRADQASDNDTGFEAILAVQELLDCRAGA
jgi:hypothetical protein